MYQKPLYCVLCVFFVINKRYHDCLFATKFLFLSSFLFFPNFNENERNLQNKKKITKIYVYIWVRNWKSPKNNLWQIKLTIISLIGSKTFAMFSQWITQIVLRIKHSKENNNPNGLFIWFFIESFKSIFSGCNRKNQQVKVESFDFLSTFYSVLFVFYSNLCQKLSEIRW